MSSTASITANSPKGAVVDQWGCPKDSDGDGVYDGLDQCPDTPHGMKVDANGCADSQKGGSAAVSPGMKEQQRPQPEPVKPSAPVSEVERQLIETGRIRLENVYFETASSRLLPESEETLREVGRTLEKFPDLEVEIEGHTDTRGPAQSSMRLSQARAEAVRAFLLQYFQLKPEHYRAAGYGEDAPRDRRAQPGGAAAQPARRVARAEPRCAATRREHRTQTLNARAALRAASADFARQRPPG